MLTKCNSLFAILFHPFNDTALKHIENSLGYEINLKFILSKIKSICGSENYNYPLYLHHFIIIIQDNSAHEFYQES